MARVSNGSGGHLEIPNVLVGAIVTVTIACVIAWINMHLKVASVDSKINVLQVYQETDHLKLQEIGDDVKGLAEKLGVATSKSAPTLQDIQDIRDASTHSGSTAWNVPAGNDG